MATNLRLSERSAAALRAAARSSGRSQQDLLREAVDRYLGLTPVSDRDHAVAAGVVRTPSAFRDVEPHIRLAPGQTVRTLLDRDER